MQNEDLACVMQKYIAHITDFKYSFLISLKRRFKKSVIPSEGNAYREYACSGGETE